MIRWEEGATSLRTAAGPLRVDPADCRRAAQGAVYTLSTGLDGERGEERGWPMTYDAEPARLGAEFWAESPEQGRRQDRGQSLRFRCFDWCGMRLAAPAIAI